MERPMRYVLALFFLASLVLPLSEPMQSMIPEPETDVSAIHNEVETLMQVQTVRLAEEQLTAIIRTLAVEAGAAPEWVQADVGTDNSGAYRLQSIRLCLPDTQMNLAAALSRQVEAQMGIRPEISYVSQGVQ
jgi:hypothetical protein